MRRRAPLLLCAALFLVLSGLGAHRDFPTHDEAPFLHYGYRHLLGEVPRDQRFNSKLPLTALHALPVLVVEKLTGRPAFVWHGDDWAITEWPLAWGRAAGVLLGAALVFLIGAAAERLAGRRAGFAAALFAALEPNLLAHLHLVTADGGATVATFLAALATLRFLRRRTLVDAALLGGALGLVLLCKFMLVVWVFSVALAVALRRGLSLRGAAVATLSLLLVVNAGFAFRGLPGRLPAAPRSKKGALARSVLGNAPLPLPRAFLEGIDWTAGDEEKGEGFGNLYLMGELQTAKRGWPWYYLVVFALKMPLPLLALAGLGLAWNRGAEWRTLRVLGVSWLLFLSLANHAQIGLRHALPLVPLLLLEAGAAYARLEARRPWLARALVVWLASSVISFAGDDIPYTNELILDRTRAYKWFADSNLDWGQSKWAVVEYLRRPENRDVRFEPAEPVKGRVVVSVNALLGVSEPPEKFAWLRAHEPVDHVRHGHLVFDVR